MFLQTRSRLQMQRDNEHKCQTINLRQRLSDSPVRILNRLPLAGKLMIVAQNDGVTHERIGIIERLEKQADRVFCIGEAHDCSIDLASVASVVIDRTARMKDRVLPKLEFQNASEETLFTVVSLDNGDKFDIGFGSFAGVPVAVPDKTSSEASSLSDDDPAFQPLRAAIEAGTEIEIQMRRPAWTSVGAESFLPSILPWGSST